MVQLKPKVRVIVYKVAQVKRVIYVFMKDTQVKSS